MLPKPARAPPSPRINGRSPGASGRSDAPAASATNNAGQQDAGDEQRAKRHVQPGGLEVNHGDCAGLPGRAELRRTNDLGEEWQ